MIKYEDARGIKLNGSSFAFLLAGALGHGAPLAFAQDYPSRPVTIFVDYPPVGGPNLVARSMPQFFSKTFGQQFVVENMPDSAARFVASVLLPYGFDPLAA